MSEEKLVPKLRFSGFDDEWEEVKLGEISTFLDNKRIPLKEDDRKHMQGEYPYYGASGIIDYVNDYIFDEELILMGEDGANIVTRSSKLIFLAKGKYWVNNHAHVIKANDDINQYFLSESLEKINYEKYNTGTAQPKLNREVCQKIKVKIPKFNEQNKIANFLSNLDGKIELLEQKYLKYKDFKKYLMQQIFAQKLRFAEFDDEWKPYKIGDISKTYSGGTPSTSKREYYEGDIPFIKSGEINKEVTEQYITEDAINNSSAKRVQKGDLLLALYGATSGEVAISKINGAINQAVLKIDNDMDNYFQYCYFLMYKDQIVHKYLQGGQGNLSANIIKKLEFKYPSLDEQKKISQFFMSIENKLELYKNKIQKYNNFKKGLLQQMFNYMRILYNLVGILIFLDYLLIFLIVFHILY